MATKHTPGPWAIRQHWADGGAFEVYPTHDGQRPENGEWTAIVEVGVNGGYEKAAKADARLIAAAPDMLAALKAYDDAMTSCWGAPEDLPAGNPDAARCWPMARAAIAKAEGRGK